MRIAVCYRGHFRRTYVTEDDIKYDINFFKNVNNHKTKLLNHFDDVDIYFNTYESDFHAENIDLLNELKPVNHIFNKNPKEKISDAIFDVNKMVNPSNYDFIFNMRFDLVFLHDFLDWNLDFNKFNFLFRDHVRPWERDKKVSDLFFAFNSKFHNAFQESINSGVIRKDKMGSAHFIYNGLLDNEIQECDINFLVEGYHSSYVKYNESKNRFISLNRGYHTDI